MVYAMEESVSFRVGAERFTKMDSIRRAYNCPVVGIFPSHFRNPFRGSLVPPQSRDSPVVW